MMLDRAKVSPRFRVHHVFNPKSGGRPAVYVTEVRRRIVGGIVMVAGLLEFVAVLLAHADAALIFIGVAIIVAGGNYALGGESGLYSVNDDGSLGEYEGKAKPARFL
ncbi:MAG: hypothetical protein ABI334_07610 [Candidatus Dormiibacterota bacterium]